MRYPHIIAAVIMTTGLAGCASGWPGGHQTDYSDLPGVRDTAKGPGLFSGDHYDSANGGGTLLYSSDHPDKAVFGSIDSHAGSGNAASDAGKPPTRSGKDFSNFRQFQAYRRFQQLPADSPEKQRFETWRQWQEYQQWESQQQSSP